jgi:peptidoglycan/xylan/chitin deacetylase (PgdA/CDA1 family)/spore germination protein YaaH/GT2 family glycosyltransferase
MRKGKNWPVFADPTGWRRHLWIAFNWAAGTLLGSLVFCVLVTSFVGPKIPPLHISGVSNYAMPSPIAADSPAGTDAFHTAESEFTRYGFITGLDETSFDSVKRHASNLDVLIVDWLRVGKGGLKLINRADRRQLRGWLSTREQKPKLVLMLRFLDDDGDVKAATAKLSTPASRVTIAHQIANALKRIGAAGVLLDGTRIGSSDAENFNRLVLDVSHLLKTQSLRTLVSVSPANHNFDFRKSVRQADAVVVQLYKQDFDPSAASADNWKSFEASSAAVLKEIDPKKLIVSVGSFGYDWATPADVDEISVSDAWSRLEDSKSQLSFEAPFYNLSFSYDDAGQRRNVWYQDAVTAYNQLQTALAFHPRGVAVWRLGTEDPSIWRLLDNAGQGAAKIAPLLTTISSGKDVGYRGKGEILKVISMARDGRRELSVDRKSNLIQKEVMRTFPAPTLIQRFGHRDDKVVALTFDDGPDPVYTPQILDVLKKKNVHGAFFVVGSMAAKYPDILKRLYREGHDIGNHTFTHANSTNISGEYLAVELNATQRLFESLLGIRTAMFRAPYSGDTEPQSYDEARALVVGASLGYASVGMSIDPRDWMRPPVDKIVNQVVDEVTHGVGNIVLLHDAGGDRSATVKALPRIIDELRERGYRFVTIHELVGQPRSAFMPPIDNGDVAAAELNKWSFRLYAILGDAVGLLFLAGIGLGIFRSFMLALGAWLHSRREKRRSSLRWQPKSLTVLIPAFNEAKVITTSIRSMLNSRYSLPFDVLVVDDGSTDQTAQIVQSEFASNDRVRVLSKPNGGKWSALNFGVQNTDSEIVVCADADTLFAPDALTWLLRHFVDPKVGAVAGATSVGNTHTLMGAFQELEYLTSQNLERRAFELFNAITVVPGAIGAWRRSAMLEAGGYNGDTLAEDADLTMALPSRDWKIVYESRAIARTEAPETIRPFLKQRFRWVFGTLQAAFKNACKGAKSTGLFWVGLLNVFVFHFLFALMAPIIDITALCAILSNFNPAWAHSAEDPSTSTATMLAYYGLFQIIDLAGASLAIHLDRKRGTWRLLPLMVIQRFCYRQLLSLVVLRAFIAICQGRVVGWASVARTGSLCGPEARARTSVPRELAYARDYGDPREKNSASGRAIAGLAGLAWAKSISVGVPVAVVAGCAIALLRVPEVTNMLYMNGPGMRPVVVAAVDLAKSGPAPVAPSLPPGIEVEPYGTKDAPGRLTLPTGEQPRRSIALGSSATAELNEVKAADPPTVAVITPADPTAQNAVVAQDVQNSEDKPGAPTARGNDVATVASSDQPSSEQPELDTEFVREGVPAIEAAEITGPRHVPLTKIADLPTVESRPVTAVEKRATVVDNAFPPKQSNRHKAKKRGRPKARIVDATQIDSYAESGSYGRHPRRHHLSAMR